MENEIIPPDSPRAEEPKKNKTKGIIKELVIFGLIAFGIVLPFRMYVAEPYLVDGRSMDPTFETGDYLIVNKLTYRNKEPARNSVVVLKYPNNPKKSFIKRIIGLPGDTVQMTGNDIIIINKENPNGFKIDQSYVTHEMPGNFSKTLENDEYFVMGDNRRESFDSRSWGPLNKKFILGQPILRLWPLTKIGFLPGNDTK